MDLWWPWGVAFPYERGTPVVNISAVGLEVGMGFGIGRHPFASVKSLK
jgi:hypothetical protein